MSRKAPPPSPPPGPLGPAEPAIRRTEGSAQHFHDRALPDSTDPEIWIHRVHSPTLVLGSAQPETMLDLESSRAEGWEVARRRSGGGLVVLQPDAAVWVDVFLAADHHLWRDDVNHAFHWLGSAWVEALRPWTEPQGLIAETNHGPFRDADVGRTYCFAGLGPGEVTLARREAPADTRPTKIVGISQRRVRRGARFQGLALLHHDPSPALRFSHPEHRASMERAVTQAEAGWPAGPPAPSPGDLERSISTVLRRLLTVDS